MGVAKIWTESKIGFNKVDEFKFDINEFIDVAANEYINKFEPPLRSSFYVQVDDAMWRFYVGYPEDYEEPPLVARRGW
jgi:hypothetical protein